MLSQPIFKPQSSSDGSQGLIRMWQAAHYQMQAFIHCRGLAATEEVHNYTTLDDNALQTYVNVLYTLNVSNYESSYNTVSITDYVIQVAISPIQYIVFREKHHQITLL